MATRFDRPTFAALLLGHAIFLIALAVSPEFASYQLTPLYVLPMLIVRRRSGVIIREFIVFAILMAVVHYLAVLSAFNVAAASDRHLPTPLPIWLPGLTGGLVGATGTFALLGLFRLLAPDRTTRGTLLIGTVVLAILGAAGLAASLTLTDARGGGSMFLAKLEFSTFIYTPWQVALAVILAKVLRSARSND